MTEDTINVCPVCQKPAEQKCSACRSVFYCSREHQKRHWKEHIKQCKSFKVQYLSILTPRPFFFHCHMNFWIFQLCEDLILGRHYVATRKIESGEIVLQEMKPLVTAPQQDTCPICLGCYTVLDAKIARPCEQCGWPLCDQCETHGEECQFTVKHRPTKVKYINIHFIFN